MPNAPMIVERLLLKPELEAHRDEINDWLRANDIEPALVLPDWISIETENGATVISFRQYKIDANGKKLKDPERPNHPWSEIRSLPLQVWLRPFWRKAKQDQDTTTLLAGRFRKKPVEVEAIQWTEDQAMGTLAAFTNGLVKLNDVDREFFVYDRLHDTWVGFAYGDWIIKGIQGEFYPCRPDVFAATYEPVHPADTDIYGALTEAKLGRPLTEAERQRGGEG